MRACRSSVAAGLALGLALWCLPAAGADPLRAGGTGGATGLLTHLGKAFTAQTGITVDIVPGLGSGGGINATADGVLDLAVSGRAPTPAERARGLVTAFIIRTPYVLATSRASPAAMSEREIIDAYATQRWTWPDGSPVKLILRPRSESDNAALMALFPGMGAALGEARKRSELPIAATDQDNAGLAETLPGSLIGATYSQITMEARDLRMVAIDGVAPTIEAFESGAYRHAKVLYILHGAQPVAAVQRFLAFMRSAPGLQTMREAGCLPGGE